MLALDLIDRRTMWRDYWIEWVLAAVLIAINEWLQWRLAALIGARLPFTAMLSPLAISICIFPVSAWLVSRIDSWRLGRGSRSASPRRTRTSLSRGGCICSAGRRARSAPY
jgi:rod shape-determining protein MreD